MNACLTTEVLVHHLICKQFLAIYLRAWTLMDFVPVICTDCVLSTDIVLYTVPVIITEVDTSGKKEQHEQRINQRPQKYS